MSIKNYDFVREFDIDTVNKSLKLYQKIEGGVNCVVWDAAIVLAKYLEVLYSKNSNYFNKNLKAIELGAGVGCVGLTAAVLGASVVLTDLKEAQALLEYTIEKNKDVLVGDVDVKVLKWGEIENFTNLDEKSKKQENRFDLILLADCIYYMDAIDPLISTLKQLSDEKTLILMSQELRDTEKQKSCWDYFLNTIKIDFQLEFIPEKDQHPDYQCQEIVLIKMHKIL